MLITLNFTQLIAKCFLYFYTDDRDENNNEAFYITNIWIASNIFEKPIKILSKYIFKNKFCFSF